MKKRFAIGFLRTIIFLLSFFVIFMLFSCSRIFYTSEKPDKTDRQNNKFKFYYYQGVKNKILNNYANAADYFNKCLDINDKVPSVYYELGQLAYIAGDLDAAKQMVMKAHNMDKSNVWYASFLVSIYEETGDVAGAKKIVKELVEAQPDNLDFLLELARIYEYEGKLDDAIGVYNEMEKQIGITEELIVQKEKLYLRMQKYKEAENEVKKLIEKYPDKINYYGELSGIYMQMNDYDKAYSILMKILKMEPTNGKIYLSLTEYYQATGKIDSAFWALSKAFELPNVELENKVDIAYNYMRFYANDSVRFDKIDTLVKILLDKYPDNVKSYTLASDFYSQKKDFKQAKKYLLKAKTLDKSNYLIWQQLMYIDNYYKDFDSLIVHGKEAIYLFPLVSRFYLYTGLGYYNKTQYDSTIKYLKKGLDYVVDSSQYRDYYYFLAESYHRIGNDDSSFYYYEKLLEIDPVNIGAMNNYSYYMALKGVNLDKADSLMRIVLKYYPVNPSYLDTYGWVLYKKKNYKEAKKYLEKAIANGGDKSAVITEHYGDVLFRTGNILEAVKYWKLAYSKTNDEKAKELLLKKIKTKKIDVE